MDAEAGRCRRTDGRKWRCYLAALRDQKYCERHVYRGRNRSKKPVEVNQNLLLKTSISPMKASATNLKSAPKTNVIRKHNNKVGIKNQSHKIKKNNTEFTVFPESAFQHDNVQVCGTLNSNNSVVVVAESVRCTSTCDNCMDHMDRGVKKVEDNSQKSNTSLSFSAGVSYQQQSGDTIINPLNEDNEGDAYGATTSTPISI